MAQVTAEQLEKIKELIEDIDINIFTTQTPEGKLRGRPMSTAKVDEDGTLWFFTNEYSGKVDEISKENEVYLTYASKSSSKYLVVHGKASLTDDQQKIKELWTPALKIWFPEGLDDPKILLIKVTPTEVEYWESASNKIVMLFGMAKALISGEEYKEGKHEDIIM